MDYPRSRREGLTVTNSLTESLVKQVSKRVKGTEKFRTDGPCGWCSTRRFAVVKASFDRSRW